MKDILVEQLTSIKKTLSGNIASIEALIDSFNAIGRLIEDLSARKQDEATIKALEDTRDNISKAIKELVKHTDDLVEAYKKMVDNI